MKTLTILLNLLPLGLFAQIIPANLHEFILQPGKDTTWCDILREQDDHLIVLRNGKEVKVPKSSLAAWRDGDLASVPFRYNEVGEVEYQSVEIADSMSATAIYQAVRLWFVETFPDSREVLEVDDKEQGLLIGTGWSNISGGSVGPYPIDNKLWFTLKIEIKEGRYRWKLYNLQRQAPPTSIDYSPDKFSLESAYPPGKPPGDKVNRKFKKSTLENLQSTINSLRAAVKKAKKSDGW